MKDLLPASQYSETSSHHRRQPYNTSTMVKPTNPDGYLATQDLKERGWTPALIARFLPSHDRERPNGLKMGRRRLPPVKLYDQQRVDEAERRDDFLEAQAKAAERKERAQLKKAHRAHARQAECRRLATDFLARAATQRTPNIQVTLKEQKAWLKVCTEEWGLNASEKALVREIFKEWAEQQRVSKKSSASQENQAKPSDWRTWDWEDA